MKKLSFITASSAILASSTFAASNCETSTGTVAVAPAPVATVKSSCRDFTGFYIGGHLGYGSGKSEWTGKDCGCYTPVQYNRDAGTRGALGGLHIGYGKELTSTFYLGLEAFGNLSNTEGTARIYFDGQSFFRAKAKRKNEFGIAIRPGFNCGNALFYVKAGVSSAKWEFKTFYSGPYPYPLPSTNNISKRKVAFVPGLGASMLIAKNIIIGVEATHSIYKKQNNHVKFSNGEIVERGKIKSHVTDVTFRASYKF